MQMHRVDTKAGTAISPAPSRMALCKSDPEVNVAFDVLDGYGGIVNENADRQGEAAQGHDVKRFSERCRA